ncbi:MAG: hypothetical protein OXG04_12455 [Acidobacteria bacterium]|nr:hypothetical protein [Acidobacteriota bacterium]
MSIPAAETYRWRRDVYDRAVEAGVFGPEDRIELIEGKLVMMTPYGSRHATAMLAAPAAVIAVADLLP